MRRCLEARPPQTPREGGSQAAEWRLKAQRVDQGGGNNIGAGEERNKIRFERTRNDLL